MIKKFNKSSIAILTTIAFFSIFALTLTAINFASAFEQEVTLEAKSTQNTETTPEAQNSPEPLSKVQDATITNPTSNSKVTTSPSIFKTAGIHNIDIIISDYGAYTTLAYVNIFDANFGPIYSQVIWQSMTENPHTYNIPNIELNTYGIYHANISLYNDSLSELYSLQTTFELIDYHEPSVSLQIESSVSGSAVEGEINNFTVTLSNLKTGDDYGMYLIVTDPEGSIRFYDNKGISIITSPQMTKTFELMPHNTNTWKIEAQIYFIRNDAQELLTTKTTTFTPIENPNPPTPTPDPITAGTTETASFTSDTPQTGENVLIALAVINLVAIVGLVAWILAHKRIVIIRPKH